MSDEIQKRGRGAPIKYRPEYCEEIVEFCAQGFSLTAFAGKIRVARSTIQEWCKNFPEFGDACQAAKAAAAFKWEERAGRVGENGGGPGTAQIVIFNLRNFASDDFKDKVSHEHSGPDGQPMRTITTAMTAKEAADAYAATIDDEG